MSKLVKDLILSIVSIAILLLIFVILLNDFTSNPTNIADWKLFVITLIIVLILYLPFAIITYFYTYIIKNIENDFVRTNKGNSVNEKLEGLKHYLSDFSLMNERDEKSLTLWEDYLIYSVIFNQNTKIIKKIYDKYFEIEL